MLKFSLGLRNALLGTSSLRTLLNGGKIRVYSGPVPASPNDALASATMLVELSAAGSGVTFESTVNDGTLVKSTSESWTGVNGASGTASFFRFVATSDGGDASTTATRIQGTVAKAGADMNLTNPVLTSGATQTLDSFYISLPES